MIGQFERIDIHKLIIPEVKKSSPDFSFDPADCLTEEHWGFLEGQARQAANINRFENAQILSTLKALSSQEFDSWNLPNPDISFFRSTESLRVDIELNKATEYRFCYPRLRDSIMPHSTLEGALDTLKDNEWIQLACDVDILGLGPKGIKELSDLKKEILNDDKQPDTGAESENSGKV